MRSQSMRWVVLVSAAALVVAGCGSGGSAPAASGGAGATCDNSDPVVVGGISSLTGPSADVGALVKAGSEVGVEDVNSKGGVLGRCLKLILKDDAGDPTTATQVTRELTDQEGAEVLVGPVLSSPTGASLEVSARAPVTHFALSANPVAGDAKTYPHAFMTEFSSAQITESMIAYLKRKGYTRPAVIAVNNALGTFLEGAFTKGTAGSGITLATAPQLHDTGLPDLSPQIRTLVDAKPDVLVVFQAAGPDEAATVKARNQLAPTLPVVGIGAMANVAATGALTADQMKDVVSGPFFQDFAFKQGSTTAVGSAAEAFLVRYRAYTQQDPLKVSASQAASAYDAVLAAAAGINGAGKTEPGAVQAWLETHPYEGTRGTYTWSATSHAGVPTASSAFVDAASLTNGLLQLAPGEGTS